MKNIYIFSILLITIVFSVEKCGFNRPDLDQYRSISNCTNIIMDQNILSPEGFFYIHFDTTDSNSPNLEDIDLDGIPDYINAVAAVADSSYRLLIDILNFEEGANGHDNITDVYVLELGGSAYGWTRPINNCYDSCIEIDNNYEEDNYYTNGVDAMKVTLLHEYFHTIQFSYRCSNSGGSSYFYELTATWIEDLGYPDINDYLNFMILSSSNSNYYNHPELDFDDTNGYSTALFGHYLSTQLEGGDGISYQNELSSEVMRKIWERIDITNNTNISNIDYVLQNEYNTTFNNVWIDFNTRNLFNNIDEDLFYYEDQALIDKIILNDYNEIYSNQFNHSYDLNYKSVSLPSFSLSNKGKCEINITANENLLSGNMVIISDSQNSNIPIFSGLTQILDQDDMIYFIFGTDETYLSINLNIEPFYVPGKPENISSITGENFIDLWWNHSANFNNELIYNIFKNGIPVDAINDSFYYDNNVNINTQYRYQITAQNNIGNSDSLSINVDTSNPDYPSKPERLNALTNNLNISLWWSKSEGLGDISYVILRDSDSIDTVVDTFLHDYNIEPNRNYEYSIFSLNKVGKSESGISIARKSWPLPEDIIKNKIINSYPNPIDISINNSLSIIIDNKNLNNTSDIILYDIKGREINIWKNILLNEGRQRIELQNLAFLPISSGLYFISNKNSSIPIIIQN